MIIENVSNTVIRVDGIEYPKSPFVAIRSTDYIKIVGINDKDNQIAVALYSNISIDSKTYDKAGDCVTAINRIIQTAHVDVEATASAKAKDVATTITQNAINSANALIPSGGIVMWSGTVPPNGWHLCDGTNGTPDLRGRFIVGYSPSDPDYNAIGKKAGYKSVTLSSNQMPSHSHSVNSGGSHNHTMSTNGNHNHSASDSGHTHTAIGSVSGFSFEHHQWNGRLPGQSWTTKSGTGYANISVGHNGSHSHTIYNSGSHTHSINSTGGSQPHENRPPYYVLAFIQKS